MARIYVGITSSIFFFFSLEFVKYTKHLRFKIIEFVSIACALTEIPVAYPHTPLLSLNPMKKNQTKR
jgi:hypothetical protein